jgi:steroid 5-alpha reductase family enzyme
MPLSVQVVALFILAIPIACVAWTVTHEEVFREPREYCERNSKHCQSLFTRKFFYLFTCEYCFSHYVAGAFLIITRYKLLYQDWRGYLIALFALVWVANLYMTVHARFRVDLKVDRYEALRIEQEVKQQSSTQEASDIVERPAA